MKKHKLIIKAFTKVCENIDIERSTQKLIIQCKELPSAKFDYMTLSLEQYQNMTLFVKITNSLYNKGNDWAFVKYWLNTNNIYFNEKPIHFCYSSVGLEKIDTYLESKKFR